MTRRRRSAGLHALPALLTVAETASVLRVGRSRSWSRCCEGVEPVEFHAPVDKRRLDTAKSGSCVPDPRLEHTLEKRDADPAGVAGVAGEPVLLAA